MNTPFRELPRVLVQGFGGSESLCRLVEEHGEYVYLVSEQEFAAAREKGEAVEPRLGFPKWDVKPA